MLDLLKQAGQIALPTTDDDPRNFWIGCIGIRGDGATVISRNGAVFESAVDNYQLMPLSHAEGRVLRKLGKGGTVYVSRIAKKDGKFAMARPCGMCQTRLRALEVDRVYYTINHNQYGVWYPKEDQDKVFEV